MEAELRGASSSSRTTYLERRKITARFLARSVPWERLEADGMAPSGVRVDPEVLIRRLAQYFATRATDPDDPRREIDTGARRSRRRAAPGRHGGGSRERPRGRCRLPESLATRAGVLLCVLMGFGAFYAKYHGRVKETDPATPGRGTPERPARTPLTENDHARQEMSRPSARCSSSSSPPPPWPATPPSQNWALLPRRTGEGRGRGPCDPPVRFDAETSENILFQDATAGPWATPARSSGTTRSTS